MRREPLQLPNIAFSSISGIIKIDEIEVPIYDVAAYLSREGDVIIEGKMDMFPRRDIRNCDVYFTDNNGWKIEGKKFIIFNEESFFQAGPNQGPLRSTFKARVLKLIAKRGEISSIDYVNVYKIETDINFASEIRVAGFKDLAVKFATEEIKNLLLFKSSIPQIPRSVGYFNIAGTFDNYNELLIKVFDNLLLLFKFAASNIINFPVTYISNSQGDELIEIVPYVKEGGQGRSIFYLSYPGTLSKLVDSTYINFVSLREILDLDKLILYYIMMKNTSFVDNAYLLGCIFMEGLKYSYAKNIKNYGVDRDRFLKADGTRYSFRELIDEIYECYNIKNKEMDFIRFRNEVIHQGAISSIPFEEIIIEKSKLEMIIEHLLLNILQYDGIYWDRLSKEWVEYKSLTP